MREFPPILYWFEGSGEVPPNYRSRFEEDGKERQCRAGQTPGPVAEKRGLLVAPFSDCIVQYQPTTQRWDKIGDRVWCGADKRTGPSDVARRRQFGGKWVRLGDGKDWLVPVANPFAATCTLPVWDRLDETGEFVREVQDQWKGLGERAARIAAEMRHQVAFGTGKVALTDTEARTLLADAMSCNYELTIQEMSVLRLFSPSACADAMLSIVDWHEMQRALLAEVEAAKASPFGDAVPTDTSCSEPGETD